MFSLATFIFAGWPSRYQNDINRELGNFLWNESGLDSQKECLSKFNKFNLDFCLYTDSQKPPTAIIIGDSHSNSLYYGLSQRLIQKKDGNLLNLGRGACIPFFDLQSKYVTGSDSCVNAMNSSLQYAVESESINTIFLLSRGITYITGKSFHVMEHSWGGHIIHKIGDNTTDFPTIYQRAMGETLDRLEATHKEVVFVIDWPEIGFNPMDCSQVDLRRIHLGPRNLVTKCVVSRSAVDDWNRLCRETIDPVLASHPNVKVFDATAAMCDESECFVMVDGKILYRDDNHFSLAGSHFIASSYLKNDRRAISTSIFE